MSMNNPTLIKTYVAAGTIEQYRIVKHDTTDTNIVQSAAATDAHIGITSILSAITGEQIDVVKSGVAKVKAGGAITRGAAVTSDASGQAVAAAPAVGVNVRVIGFAEASAVVGDVFPVLIAPSVMQG